MRQILLSALFACALALPAAAQMFNLEGILIEPRHPTESDRIRLTVVGEGACIDFHPVYDEATGSVVVQLGGEDCIGTPIPFPIRETFEIGPLPAGRHFVEIPTWPNPVTWRELFEVGEDTALDLGEDFEVRVHWSNPRDGSSGPGNALRMAHDSGAFWFFSPDNLEVTIKILDGRAINGRRWVFIASMTDLQLEIEIAHAGGPVKTYVQTAGANRNFIDVNAFEEGPTTGPAVPDIAIDPEHPTAADLVRIEVAVPGAVAVDFAGLEGRRFLFNSHLNGDPPPPQLSATGGTTAGPLAPGIYMVDVRTEGIHEMGRTFEVSAAAAGPALRLREASEDHFDIEVHYRLPGQAGFATAPAVPLTQDAGYFYFFDPGNAEVTAKIVDGRGLNGHWWVFLANMTTVELEIEVTRCPPDGLPLPCVTKTYVQPAGQNQNFLDTSTF